MAVTGISLALTVGAPGAFAANLVLNGDFSSFTPGTPPSGSGAPTNGDLTYSPVTDWSTSATDATGSTPANLLFIGTNSAAGTFYQDVAGGATGYAVWGLHTNPPNSAAGGNFIALDGDPAYNSALTQTINGLTPGQTYALSFYWAGAQLSTTSGATTEQLQVSLGSQTQDTSVVSNVSEGFTGWKSGFMIFTANSSSETLSFLSMGTPSGYPPMAVLAGVSLNAVPEPSSLLLVVVGLFGVGVVRRMRKPASA